MRLLLAALLLLAAPAPAQDVASAGLFVAPAIATGSADVAVDGKGVRHMAFAGRGTGPEAAPAIYAVCADAAACAAAEGWALVPLGQGARSVQVATTPKGAPRLLIASDSVVQAGGLDWSYAECDRGCDTRAGWTVTLLRTAWDSSMSEILSDRLARRTFAVDAQGRPRFLFTDRNYLVEPDHYGAFFMSCESGCADAANWVETDLARHQAYDTEIFDRPALALTADGRPRLAARIFGWTEAGEDAESGVYYLACEAGCTDPAAWRRTMVFEAGSGSYPSPTWDLAVDGQGRPRLALFAGDGMTDPTLDNALIYFWCDGADCLADEAWSGQVVQTGQGEGASLALTPEGHPRLAFTTGDRGLGVASCDEACETFEGGWTALYVEGQDQQAAARPTALPFTCDGEVWESLAPQAALTDAGRLLVAMDVGVEARCLYREVGEPEITYEFHPLWRGARLVEVGP